MTQEELKDFKSKFEEYWQEFTAKYSSYNDFPIKEIAQHFFEAGRSDIMDRVWGMLRK